MRKIFSVAISDEINDILSQNHLTMTSLFVRSTQLQRYVPILHVCNSQIELEYE